MPGPENKRKAKPRSKAKRRGSTNDAQPTTTHSSVIHERLFLGRCLTFEEDGVTQCGQPATEGHPQPDRCKAHHGQYRTLYKKYKDASKVVDEIKDGADLPTKEQITHYTDWHAALEKARWVRKYLEVIRVEKTGREIHQKRFFLKVDDGHRHRLKVLEREMVRAVDVLDALQGRAYDLYRHDNALYANAMNCSAPSAAEVDLGKQSKRIAKEVLDSLGNSEASSDSVLRIPRKSCLPVTVPLDVGDEDLVDMALRDQKESMMAVFEVLIDFELFLDYFRDKDSPRPETEHETSVMEKQFFFIFQQFARRIIFHEPTLFMKSLGKVSFKDLVLSGDFSMEDVAKFLALFLRPLEFPLKWFKDAVLDALVMSRHGTAANAGKVEDRFPLLGGWVFGRSHTTSMPDEAWWLLLTVLQPPANMENRFVRLCNNFEDLVGFLSFAAFGLVPSPNFCQSPPHFDADDPALSRKALSLSGIIVADMVSTPRPPNMCGPMPTTQRATRRGCIIWAEVETRAYMFGAVSHERGGFVEAFLSELRARPDLFQVVLRSETDPGRRVEMFGSSPSNEALPAMRTCQFEAPFSSPPPSPPSPQWKVEWSAKDVLYGARRGMKGYLTSLEREPAGWFFRFKTFPVTYFVVLDTVPYRSRSVLARNVAWAALRAGGYANGEYTLRKYAAASDKLLEQRAQERLAWLPEELWGIKKLQDQLQRESYCGIQ